MAVGREAAAVEAAGAQPDHFLFAVDDFEGQVGPDLHHDHVDRVGADVDGGDAHEGGSAERPGLAMLLLVTGRYILPVRSSRPHPTMNRTLPLVRLLERRTRALKRYLAAAVKGDGIGVHQARVASRRLREAVPVLTDGLQGTKAGKARRKIRRLTRALGTVRELDVTLHLIDELGESRACRARRCADVRAHVIEAREQRRAVMLERLGSVDIDKLVRRLDGRARGAPSARRRPTTGARRSRSRIAKRARRLGYGDRRGRADLRARGAAPGAHRRPRSCATRMELADESGAAPSAALRANAAQARRTRSAGCTICRCCSITSRSRPRRRRRTGRHPTPALAILARSIEDECRHLHGRYVAHAARRCIEAVADGAPRYAAAADGRVARDRARAAKMTLPSRAPRRERTALMAMLELYLIRHGIAEERGEDWPDDSKRPLTPDGISRSCARRRAG